jgi:hypothetical protein
MNSKFLKVLTVSISVVVSIVITTIIFKILGNENDALKATCIAFMCAAFALDLYPRLTSRFSKSKSKLQDS